MPDFGLDTKLDERTEHFARMLVNEAYKALPVHAIYAEVYLFYAHRLLHGWSHSVEEVVQRCREDLNEREEHYEAHPDQVRNEYYGANRRCLQLMESYLIDH